MFVECEIISCHGKCRVNDSWTSWMWWWWRVVCTTSRLTPSRNVEKTNKVNEEKCGSPGQHWRHVSSSERTKLRCSGVSFFCLLNHSLITNGTPQDVWILDLPRSSDISNGCRENGRCNFLTSNFAWQSAQGIEPAAFIIFPSPPNRNLFVLLAIKQVVKNVRFITGDSLCVVRFPSVTSKFQSSCHFSFLVADRDKLD